MVRKFMSKNYIIIQSKIILLIIVLSVLSGCATNLSGDVYTSGSTMSLTLEGSVISARPVTIKDSQKMTDNTTGMVAGGLLGAVGGAAAGNGRGLATVGGGLAGAALGAVLEDKLSTSKGMEYIVKLDMSKFKDGYYEGTPAMRNVLSTAKTSGLITVVQSASDNVVAEGQKVYVIFSNNRTRVIPAK